MSSYHRSCNFTLNSSIQHSGAAIIGGKTVFHTNSTVQEDPVPLETVPRQVQFIQTWYLNISLRYFSDESQGKITKKMVTNSESKHADRTFPFILLTLNKID